MGQVILNRGQGDVSPGQQGVVGVRRFVDGGKTSGLPVVDVFPGIHPLVKFLQETEGPLPCQPDPPEFRQGQVRYVTV